MKSFIFKVISKLFIIATLIYILINFMGCSNPVNTTIIDNTDTTNTLYYMVEYRAEGIFGNWTSETYVKYKMLDDTIASQIIILRDNPWSRKFIGKTGDILYLASNTGYNQQQKTRLSIYVDGILTASDSTNLGTVESYKKAMICDTL